MKRFFFIFCVLLLACSSGTEKKLSSREKELATVYAQLHQVRRDASLNDTAQIDSSRAILKRHQLTQERFDAIVSGLHQKPERWELFYQEVKDQLESAPPQKRP